MNSGLIVFAGSVTALPENADAFVGYELSPSNSDAPIISICPDVSAAINPATPGYTILGGNKSASVGDMFPVADDSGASGAKPLTQPFIKTNFPFKYFGIQFSCNGDAGAGTVAFYLAEKIEIVKLSDN